VHLDPLVVQAAIAIPICLGLVLYTLIRWEWAALHGFLAALLTLVTLWLAGATMKVAADTEWVRLLGLYIESTTVLFMPPLLLTTMGYFARSPLFEQSNAPTISLFAVSTCFLIGCVTDNYHHLYFADRDAALAGMSPTQWAGPIFWGSQVWTAVADSAAFVYCGNVLFRGATRAERGRAAMIFTAVLIPTLAHLAYMLKLLPLDYSLAPGALAFTAIFFVNGVHRYGLLGGQTIVRHDLIEHLDDGLVLADEYGIVLDANAAAENALGVSRSGLRGLGLNEVLALVGTDESAGELGDRILALPLDGSRVMGELRTADERLLDVKGGAVAAIGSQPSGRFVSIQDRTIARRNERLLRERQKLESVGILAAGVAHEVNNPLAYVRANLSHLQSTANALAKHETACEIDDVEEMPEILAESIDGLDRIARIVQSMLRLSRVPDESHHEIDPNEVVAEAIRLADLKRGSSVHSTSDDTDLRVIGSAEQLVQVLLNLLLNAKHAARDQEDTRIEANIRRDGQHAVIDVRDNGPGIPHALHDRVFDPFFTTRGPSEGTGLGLSIAFDIVREHGGLLELASQPGEGTCFSIRLPLV
jgi:PAS domain S-box-containing protein